MKRAMTRKSLDQKRSWRSCVKLTRHSSRENPWKMSRSRLVCRWWRYTDGEPSRDPPTVTRWSAWKRWSARTAGSSVWLRTKHSTSRSWKRWPRGNSKPGATESGRPTYHSSLLYLASTSMSRGWPTSKCPAKKTCWVHISNASCNAVARTLTQACATWLAIHTRLVGSWRLARESQTTAPFLAQQRLESDRKPEDKTKN